MAAFCILALLGFLFVKTVESAGNLYGIPHHGDACYYEDLKDAHFSYDKNTCRRPIKWCYLHKCWTTCGSDRRQSPIDIDTFRARKTNASVELHNMNMRVPAIIYNSGHAPHFIVNPKHANITLRLKNVAGIRSRDIYTFKDLHFHLGKTLRKGSEHSIDGTFYPMEAHLVFYNSKYGSIIDAKSEEGGLVVIGVMIEVDNKRRKIEKEEEYEYKEHEKGQEKKNFKWNTSLKTKYSYSKLCRRRNYRKYKSRGYNYDYLKRICGSERRGCKVKFAKTLSYLMEKYFGKVKEYNQKEEAYYPIKRPNDLQCGKKPSPDLIKNNCKKGVNHNFDKYDVDYGISAADVLPVDKRFYTYPGSLTTPPCYESVQWIVYKCPIVVSRKAFRALQQVEDVDKKPLKKHGVRRTLQKNKLTVLRNF